MKYYVEFRTTNRLARQCLRLRLNGFTGTGAVWRIWEPICAAREYPHLSIIDANHLSRMELIKTSNSCLGSSIVLWGTSPHTMGLPVLPSYFSEHHLLALMPSPKNRVSHIRPDNSTTARSYDPCPQTVPIPLFSARHR